MSDDSSYAAFVRTAYSPALNLILYSKSGLRLTDCHFVEMILLEVENRGVQDALNNHFEAAKEKGRFDKVAAKICDFDGCIYSLTNPDGNREQLQVTQRHTPQLPKNILSIFFNCVYLY